MPVGKDGRDEASRRALLVRSVARRRALAVARREGRGGGGVRAVMRVVRREGDGGGREAEMMALRSCEFRSMTRCVLCRLVSMRLIS